MDLVRISCKMWGWIKLAQDHIQWLTRIYRQGVTTGNDATDHYICMCSSKRRKILLYCCCTKQHTHNSVTGAAGVQ